MVSIGTCASSFDFVEVFFDSLDTFLVILFAVRFERQSVRYSFAHLCLYSINVVNNNCLLLRWMLIKQSVVKTHDYVVVDN